MIQRMDRCNISLRKRRRTSCQSTTRVIDRENCASRRKGCVNTYQFAFCVGVLLVQLARVHSWSPSSLSSIAKKTMLSAAVQIPGESDSLALEQRFSRHRIHDLAVKENSNNALKMAVSPPGSQQPVGPSMLIGDDFFFPISSRTARTSPDSVSIGAGNSAQSEEKSREGRVLGFDVFELQAKKSESIAGDEAPIPGNNSESLFSSSELTWQNLPLSTTAKDADSTSPASTQLTHVPTSLTTGSGQRNGGVRLLRYSSPLLPAWFPWIPTKSQIMTLKLKELREACSQRGLAKVGCVYPLSLCLHIYVS